jgi:hypothetical protein
LKYDCFNCCAPTFEKEEDFKNACAGCRDILKYELVRKVLELDRVYLSESNRNKKGRKKKIDAGIAHEIKWLYANNPQKNSYGKLAKRYNVSKGTIYNIIRG